MLRMQRNMALWALRDLMRRPGESLVTAGVILLLTATIAPPLIIDRVLSQAVDTILSAAPAVVVRRIDPTGWRPIPLAAVAAVSQIPGAITVRPRIWGRVPTATGVATVVAWLPQSPFPQSWKMRAPAPGTVVVGPGIPAAESITVYRTDGTPLPFKVDGRLPPVTALMAADVIVMHPDDARALLGIPEDCATDLTADVFHDAEITAVVSDLVAALPFPVHVDDRKSAAGRYHAAVAAGSGSRIAQYFPALLTLLLLALVTLRQGKAGLRETGLLKAVGWSAADIHRRHLFSALWVGLPSVTVGALAAYVLVTLPSMAGIAALFWGRPLPMGIPAAVTADIGIVLVEISSLVLIPFVVSVGLAGLITGTRMTGRWLPEAGGRP